MISREMEKPVEHIKIFDKFEKLITRQVTNILTLAHADMIILIGR